MADYAGHVFLRISEFHIFGAYHVWPLRGALVGQAIAKVVTLVTEVTLRDYMLNVDLRVLLAGGAERMAGDTIVKKVPCLNVGGSM